MTKKEYIDLMRKMRIEKNQIRNKQIDFIYLSQGHPKP